MVALCPDRGSLITTEMVTTRGQSCDRSLAEAKEFQVTTENFSVTTGFHGVVSRQSIFYRDRVWPRPKGVLLRQNIFRSR